MSEWLATLVRTPLTSSHLPVFCASGDAACCPCLAVLVVVVVDMPKHCVLSGGSGVDLFVVHSCVRIFDEVVCPLTASLTYCVNAL